MYSLGLASRVLVVATVLLCSIGPATSTDGTDHDAGIHKDGQQARTDSPPFDQKSNLIMSQLRAYMKSTGDHLHQTHEQLVKQHVEDSELIPQLKNGLGQEKSVASDKAQIIEELQQKVSLEAARSSLLKIKSKFGDLKQKITDQLIEFDRFKDVYIPYTLYEPKQSKIVEQISAQVDNFQKVFKTELDTALKNIDELRLKGYRQSQQYGPARVALDKLKSEFEHFRWYLANQLSRVTKQTRGDLSESINKKTKEFNGSLKQQLAKAFDCIAY